MSNIQEMLELNGGSFVKAEAMARQLIKDGRTDIWLDLSLLQHAQGKTLECRASNAEYKQFFPDCPRLAFGEAWWKLYDGDLKGGLEHIEHGRSIGTLGDQNLKRLKGRLWNGEDDLTDKTVLLVGEGGMGDQIMGVRSAKHLATWSCTVIVACSKELCSLFRRCPGVTATVDLEAANSVSHDYYVPMMSSYRLMSEDWGTLWPGPYVKPCDKHSVWSRVIVSEEARFAHDVTPRHPQALKVGIRWKGNPRFEHEQLRVFPPELMWDAVYNDELKVYSLQKDCGEKPPEWVTDLEPLLGDWEQTAAAISNLDLVITSCTGVAHLSAAMGKETWVVVPAMPYYPWARPGSKSDWYPSVRLFRQERYGEWKKPFEEIFKALKERT